MNEDIKTNDVDLNSLFEEPIPEPETKPILEPSDNTDSFAAEPDKTEDVEITPDSIIDALDQLNEDGYTDAVIVADLSRLHNVTKDTTLDNISEDDREYVDQIKIENAVFGMYSMDGNLFNVTLKFDTVKDAYMKDLNELLNRYRVMQEQIATSEETDTMAMFTLTLMPNKLNGLGVLNISFPVAYFRVLDDNGVNATLLMQFYVDNLEFMKLNIDEDTRAEISADVMREAEVENGSGGSLFEE